MSDFRFVSECKKHWNIMKNSWMQVKQDKKRKSLMSHCTNKKSILLSFD